MDWVADSASIPWIKRTLRQVTQEPKVGSHLEGQRVEINPNAPEVFRSFVKADQDKWAAVVKASGAARVK